MLVLTFVQLSNLLQDMLLELIDSLGFQGQYVARLKSLHSFVVFHDAKLLKLDSWMLQMDPGLSVPPH